MPVPFLKRIPLLFTFALVLFGVCLMAVEIFLPEREALIATATPLQPALQIDITSNESHEYIEVVESCDPYYRGACVNMRADASTTSPAVAKLRTGIVLKTAGLVESEGALWYKIAFDEWLRHPDRLDGDRYVIASAVQPVLDRGSLDWQPESDPPTHKRIIVDRSEQKLYAYDGDVLFMEESISTGLDLTPTPRGEFNVFRKTPSRYMQGPIEGISEKVFDLPGVPWNLYFTYQGAVIHGAYWHDHFGAQWSNGCVNLPPQKAKELYYWADLGTKVIVRD